VTFLLVEPPITSRAGGGNQDSQTKKTSAVAAALKSFPIISPAFSCMVPGYLSGKPASAPTLHPPIARQSSTLVSRASLPLDPGSHSLILSVCMSIVGSGGVEHGHHCMIQKGKGGAEIIHTLRTELLRRRFTMRIFPPLDLTAPPVATVLLVACVLIVPCSCRAPLWARSTSTCRSTYSPS
jgi:hypothetical protein